ncbi:hypothetical protein M1N84_01105 [Dehalococcoidia bacterium]|nr:hypothetical protein [Dehalococcoidia bacterium]
MKVFTTLTAEQATLYEAVVKEMLEKRDGHDTPKPPLGGETLFLQGGTTMSRG